MMLLASSAAFAADLDTYRDFKLGSSTAAVIARTSSIARDLKTIHVRPALLQELAWRPPYVPGGPASGRDSARSVAFSFVGDQLFRIVVDYETTRTEGMTRDDMIASLSLIYGASSVPAARPRQVVINAVDAASPIARWQRGDVSVTLQHAEYSGRFGLVIVSLPLELRASQALAEAAVIEKREAPVREAERVKAAADATKAAAEKTRNANKATFKP